MNRIVEPEWLDDLAPDDPRALRSRRDIRRLNVLMGHPRLMADALVDAIDGAPVLRLVEFGAGDGHFLLRVARRLAGGRKVAATLVDRLNAFDASARRGFDAAGWHVRSVTADALDWLRGCRIQADVTLCNLLLHQFSEPQLSEFFKLASGNTRVLIALEPRRGAWPLLCSYLLRFTGCGAVSCHDGPISIRAGFAGTELSSLWAHTAGARTAEPGSAPRNSLSSTDVTLTAASGGNWELIERKAGPFSHLFVARRKSL